MFLPSGIRLIGDIQNKKYRIQYPKELQMLKIFNTQPDMKLLNSDVIAIWNKVGPFKFETYVNKSYIILPEAQMKPI